MSADDKSGKHPPAGATPLEMLEGGLDPALQAQMQQMMLQSVAQGLADTIVRLNPTVSPQLALQAATTAARAHHEGACNQALDDADPGSEAFIKFGMWKIVIVKQARSQADLKNEKPLAELQATKDLAEAAKNPHHLMGYLMIYSMLTSPIARAFLLAHGYDMRLIQVKKPSKLLL